MFGIDQQVQQTADAYRGKPQMLQQKYAQNQQLIDLLALQKLKSDKEAASRQMALSMGGKPPTIADQRESQVLDMTKKEVVDQQAGIMQQKMQQQQDAQKKLLQSAGAPQMPGQATPQPQQPPSAGLAGLPANNIAPKMMAGGGIVAFGGGGSTDKEKEQRERDRAAVTNTIEQLIAAGKDVLTAPGRGIAGAAESVITRPLRAAGVPLPYLPESFYGGDRESLTPYADKLARESAANQAINASRRLPADEATPAYAGAVARQAQARDEAQPPAPPPQAAPQGTGGGTPMGNAPGTVGFGIQSLIGTKTPEEAARENEARAAAAANFNPEERAGKQRMIDERSASYDRNKLARALMAMSGYSSPALAIAAGGGQAANDADQAMRERQRGENELIDIGPASRIAGTKAGESRFKDVLAGMAQGVDAAVKQAQVASAAADRQLAREGMDYNKAAQVMATLTGRITTAKKIIDDAYTKSVNGLFITGGRKPTNAEQQAIDTFETTRRLGLAELDALIGPQLLAAEKKMGIPSSNGFSIVGIRPNTPPK
jgi:hypothetical protein